MAKNIFRGIFAAAIAAVLPLCVCAGTIYVSPDGSGDGSSSDSPAALSNALILGASEGDTIMAAAGTYTVSEALALTNSTGSAVTLQGASRDETIFTVSTSGSDRLFVVGNGTIRNLTVTGDLPTTGEAITVAAGVIDSCTFSSCTMTNKKYLVYASAKAIVTNCTVTSSTSCCLFWDNARNGAAIFDTTISGCSGASGNNYGQCLFGWYAYRCRFLDHTPTGEESFLHTTFYDCLISGVVGRALRSMTAYNTTIMNCKGAMTEWGSHNFYNCLLWNNRASTSSTADLAQLGGKFYNCWIEEDVSGGTRNACITGTDPKLNSDGTLSAGSPCIDTGDNSYYSNSAYRPTDLFGGDRVYNSTIDIGCFEKNGYADGETFFSLDQSSVSGTSGEALSASFQYRADEGVSVTVDWDFGDGSTSQTTLVGAGGSTPASGTVTHTFSVGGSFDLGATVTFGDGSDGVESSVAGKFLVQNASEGDVYVSTSGSDANDGLTESAAKATVVSAVAAVYPGYKVIVKSGTYDMAYETQVTKAVEICGEGRDATILSSSNTSKRMFTFNNANILFRDMTIQGVTNTVTSGGAIIKLNKGTLANIAFLSCKASSAALVDYDNTASAVVTNCLFDSCYAPNMINCDGSNNTPLVVDTDFLNCTGTSFGGMIHCGTAYRCRVENCTANSSAFIYVVAYDCLFKGNSGTIQRGRNTYNCSFLNNTATVFSENNQHFNDIIWGNSKEVSTGRLYNCLVDNASSSVLTSGNITNATDALLKADGTPKSASPAIGAARYMNDDSTAIDTMYFPSADMRTVDINGNPRVRSKSGVWLDIGCLQGVLGNGMILLLR